MVTERTLATITFFTPVQELIHLVEERMRAQSRGHHSELGAALDHLLTSGGKRVRPAVTLLMGGMLGAEQDRLITLAAAIELLHTATLVHDDLIDGSLLRRGIETINAQWSPAATVLTGDFIFARAAGLAADTGSVSVMKMFAETLSTIVNGEITQLFGSRGLASRQDYYRRIHAKTASLFELCTGAAALLSPVGEEIILKTRRYGREIGMAFQIVDDVLDFTGEQVTVGKPVGSDLQQGLITLPALCYLESNPSDPDMRALLNGSRYDETRVDRLVKAIRESGAVEQALGEAREFVQRGIDALYGFPAGEERQALEDLAYYILDRRS
jgi:geranylgeranyl pyrophosphate synthase